MGLDKWVKNVTSGKYVAKETRGVPLREKIKAEANKKARYESMASAAREASAHADSTGEAHHHRLAEAAHREATNAARNAFGYNSKQEDEHADKQIEHADKAIGRGSDDDAGTGALERARKADRAGLKIADDDRPRDDHGRFASK